MSSVEKENEKEKTGHKQHFVYFTSSKIWIEAKGKKSIKI